MSDIRGLRANSQKRKCPDTSPAVSTPYLKADEAFLTRFFWSTMDHLDAREALVAVRKSRNCPDLAIAKDFLSIDTDKRAKCEKSFNSYNELRVDSSARTDGIKLFNAV
jgi:hypothetical protein